METKEKILEKDEDSTWNRVYVKKTNTEDISGKHQNKLKDK